MIGQDSFDDIDVQIAWIEHKIEKNKEEILELLQIFFFESDCLSPKDREQQMIEFAEFCSDYELQQKIDAEERIFEEMKDEG